MSTIPSTGRRDRAAPAVRVSALAHVPGSAPLAVRVAFGSAAEEVAVLASPVSGLVVAVRRTPPADGPCTVALGAGAPVPLDVVGARGALSSLIEGPAGDDLRETAAAARDAGSAAYRVWFDAAGRPFFGIARLWAMVSLGIAVEGREPWYVLGHVETSGTAGLRCGRCRRVSCALPAVIRPLERYLAAPIGPDLVRAGTLPSPGGTGQWDHGPVGDLSLTTAWRASGEHARVVLSAAGLPLAGFVHRRGTPCACCGLPPCIHDSLVPAVAVREAA